MYKDLILTDSRGTTFPAYLTRQKDNVHSRPGLILIEEIWGLNDHIKDVARRFSDEGYVTLAPELLGENGILEKIGSKIGKDLHDPAKTHEAQIKMRDISRLLLAPDFAQGALDKLTTSFEYLMNLPETDGCIAVVGFCFGGTYAFQLAIHEPRLKSAVAFYGHEPKPLAEIEKIACPVLAFYGEKDTNLVGTLPDLKAEMKNFNKKFNCKVYPNTGHAFFNDTDKLAYDKDAAADAWRRTLEFLEKNIGRC